MIVFQEGLCSFEVVSGLCTCTIYIKYVTLTQTVVLQCLLPAVMLTHRSFSCAARFV